MPQTSFRFLHSSDLHLEQPLHGVSQVPDHLREEFIDAPYQAARQVFQAAIRENVVCLALAGDIVQTDAAGPRALEFLRSEFGRLHDHNIPVVWVGGQVDPPGRWPAQISLSPNVRIVAAGQTEEIACRDDEQTVAVVAARSHAGQRDIQAADFRSQTGGPFRIAVGFGNADPTKLAEQQVNYWALGGRHARKTVSVSPRGVHYSGTPQGRNPNETGAHGCTLTHVAQDGSTRCQLVTTDTLRWHDELVPLSAAASRDDLEEALRQRVATLRQSGHDRHLLVRWTIQVDGQLGYRLRRGGLAAEIVNWLRDEFGHLSPCVWTIELQSEPASLPAAWLDEDTILGDFLRVVRRFQSELDEPLSLEQFVAGGDLDSHMLRDLRIAGPAERRNVLRQVALLGVDLLRGTETHEPEHAR